MTLTRWEDADQQMRAVDRAIQQAESDVEFAAGDALQVMLGRMLSRVRGCLTASSLPCPFSAGELFTLGEAQRWWSDAVEETLTQTVLRTWTAAYSATTDMPLAAGSLASAGEYVAAVTDRLSRTAQPLVPDQAFNLVRVGLVEEMGRGSPVETIARRIASDLSWTGPDRQFWESRRADVLSQIDAILDPLGPPGTGRREEARLNDPRVRELQRQNAQAVRALDDDASTWRRRATLIARTETTGAWNAGNLQAGLVEGQQVKMWLALSDDRTRDTHLEAAGQCVPIDGTFRVGDADMLAPGVAGPVEEVANCRCQLLFAESCDEAGRMSAPAADRWAAERMARLESDE